MIPYILLLLVPGLFLFIAIKKNSGSGRICIGKTEYIDKNNLALPVFFFIFFLLLALRDESIGNDTMGYRSIFLVYGTEKFADTLYYGFEPLYSFLNWIVFKITDNFQWFLAIASMLCVWPVAGIYNEDRKNSFLKIVLFVNMTTFAMYFSGIRQAIAMSMGMIAYKFVKEKKILWFVLACFAAMGFHHSAFMLFFMYPLYYMTLKKKHLWFIIPVIVVCFIFNVQVFTFLTNILAVFSDEYDNIVITETGALTSFLMFIAFAVMSYVIPDEKKMDKETMGLRNFLLLSVVLQSFASVHILAMRMNYYFILFIPVLLAKIVEIPKKRFSQFAQAAKIGLTAFFTLYFLYTLYRAYTTGSSTLSTMPYVPFWENQL